MMPTARRMSAREVAAALNNLPDPDLPLVWQDDDGDLLTPDSDEPLAIDPNDGDPIVVLRGAYL